MGNHDADTLGAIHGAAATDRDDHIALFATVSLGAGHDLFNPRVGRNLGVQAVINGLFLQAGFDISHPAGGDHPWVADQQDLARAKGLGVIGDMVTTTGAEDDFRGDELAQLAQFRAHGTLLFLL
ncbi:hypothetical protein D3C76_1133370 [compost metagenome]